MDEPLSNLDAKLRVSTRAEIKYLQSELKVTTIYVTHDQIEAMTLADRVVVMNKGLILQIGTPKEIYNKPDNTFVASFIGTPAMNLLQGQLQDGIFSIEDIQIDNLLVNFTGQMTLGFRAEDAKISDDNCQMKAMVFSLELLGDCMMVNLKIGQSIISVKEDKDFSSEIGKKVGIKISTDNFHYFDTNSGKRIS